MGSGFAALVAAGGAEGDALLLLGASVSVLMIAGYLHQGLSQLAVGVLAPDELSDAEMVIRSHFG